MDVALLDTQRAAQLRVLDRLPAGQQPPWHDHPELPRVRQELAGMVPLVDQDQIRKLRQLMSRVQHGAALLLHVGECAETFAMSTPVHVQSRIELYGRMADHLADRTGRDVVVVARMAGQHAKPRSEPMEILPSGELLPTYRGDAVNRAEPRAMARRADPARLLASYYRSRDTLEMLRGRLVRGQRVFVSHEALVRDYETALTRLAEESTAPSADTGAHYHWAQLFALSGHLLWIGDRTRQLANWHVQWASSVANPIGVKLGPGAAGTDVVNLARALNPRREQGRLSLIPRIGAVAAAARLPDLVQAGLDIGVPIVWQCDPMHGNTRKLDRTKLRLLPDIRTEISTFVQTLRRLGCRPGGLHLEVTPEPVQECHEELALAVGSESHPPCDPRLNPSQAMDIVDHFANEIGD
ncbi:3-deoxy-7-phosphoheptulonate synthase [Micromonospora sp. CPCC 206061]|uniref:3-deoxy-7-phosphoheptulonate synthase n=1 Tax=Micromonospora sp. CPCC 206061 TaxID=3122410 RepID=UPI002FF2744A